MKFLLSITIQQIPDSKSAAKHRKRYIFFILSMEKKKERKLRQLK